MLIIQQSRPIMTKTSYVVSSWKKVALVGSTFYWYSIIHDHFLSDDFIAKHKHAQQWVIPNTEIPFIEHLLTSFVVLFVFS